MIKKKFIVETGESRLCNFDFKIYLLLNRRNPTTVEMLALIGYRPF